MIYVFLQKVKGMMLFNRSLQEREHLMMLNIHWKTHVLNNYFNEFIEESFNNFDSLKLCLQISSQLIQTENQLIENLSQVISLKNNLAQINNKDLSESEKSFSPEQKNNRNSNDKLLVSSTLRYKTHQNLGSSQFRQRLISNPSENNKAFSELDEVEEDLDSDHKAALMNDGMYMEEEMILRQPWYYRSAMPQQLSNKTESKNWEFGSERKRFKSKPSLASFTSNSSCLKGCTMTLKEDFQNIQQSQQSERVIEDDEFKEKDTEVNNSYEIAQLVQQEQIISDSTILINRKHKSVKFADFNEKEKKYSAIKYIGVTICSIGVLCWGAKKFYEKKYGYIIIIIFILLITLFLYFDQ